VRDDTSALQARIVERLRFVNGHADNWRLFDDAELFAAVVAADRRPKEVRRHLDVAAR